MAYVLVVDDDEDFANVIATVLREEGHEVETLLTTRSVIETLKEKKPDLLVLDVMFPENSSAGFELARRIHENQQQFGNLPVLMVTAINQTFPLGFSAEDIDESWLPVSDFVEKPIDFTEFIEKANRLINSSETQCKNA